jgi:hypothetical protein
MDTALKWFINGWVTLAVLVNIVAIIGLFAAAPSFLAGWWRVTEIYSPFNFWNAAAEIVLFLPAIGAAYWREHRQKR